MIVIDQSDNSGLGKLTFAEIKSLLRFDARALAQFVTVEG